MFILMGPGLVVTLFDAMKKSDETFALYLPIVLDNRYIIIINTLYENYVN